MTFLIGIFIVTIALPLLVLFFRRNFKTLLVSYLPFLATAYYYVHPECAANRSSEACTWGYLNYSIALIMACAVYLIVSLLQFLWAKFKRKKKVS